MPERPVAPKTGPGSYEQPFELESVDAIAARLQPEMPFMQIRPGEPFMAEGPVPEVPLMGGGAQGGAGGALMPLLAILGIAGLSALGSQTGKGRKPAGRTSYAGSLERADQPTQPDFLQRLLQAGASGLQTYAGIQLQQQQQKEAEQMQIRAEEREEARGVRKEEREEARGVRKEERGARRGTLEAIFPQLLQSGMSFEEAAERIATGRVQGVQLPELEQAGTEAAAIALAQSIIEDKGRPAWMSTSDILDAATDVASGRADVKTLTAALDRAAKEEKARVAKKGEKAAGTTWTPNSIMRYINESGGRAIAPAESFDVIPRNYQLQIAEQVASGRGIAARKELMRSATKGIFSNDLDVINRSNEILQEGFEFFQGELNPPTPTGPPAQGIAVPPPEQPATPGTEAAEAQTETPELSPENQERAAYLNLASEILTNGVGGKTQGEIEQILLERGFRKDHPDWKFIMQAVNSWVGPEQPARSR